ncbi:MAG: hypothetical protein CM1200mP1_04380 [Candidatus Neomarinimicrobiota bacterium]|nr:MAG: hypothetical protein CM1200mP1_04380 [Candidatus Neomarinimicrobiota bacterium]
MLNGEKEFLHDHLTKDDGTQVAIAKCPEGHGKIKSPMCCGHDMVCELKLINFREKKHGLIF